MFVNTQEFRREALSFKKEGRYPYGDEPREFYRRHGFWPKADDLSHGYNDYWEEQIRRCVNGYSVGSVPITGEHYLYLNFLPIERAPETFGEIHNNRPKKARQAGKRDFDFPAFWDEDWRYFTTCDIARWGVGASDATFEERQKEYRRLCSIYDLGLVEDEDNFIGGLHHLWLKIRGVGASYKGAAKPIHNQFFVPRSNTFLIADMKAYLLGDGTYTKYLAYRSWLLANAPGFRQPFSKQATDEMKFVASYHVIEGNDRIEKGMQSTVYGISLDGDTDKARGKRGDIIWEEAGTFGDFDAAWDKALNSVDQYGFVYGQMRGFGTGGDAKQRYEAMAKMGKDPRSYKILRFKNIYHESMAGTECAMFTPSYKNLGPGNTDADGNSLVEVAKPKEDAQREEKKAAHDPAVFNRYCAEPPYHPGEMFSAVTESIFPKLELEAHLNYIQAHGYSRTLPVVGEFIEGDRGVEFQKNSDLTAYDRFPVASNHDKTGAVVRLYPPFRQRLGEESDRLVTPANMYVIGLDPYNQTSSSGDSVGAAYVYENPNHLTQHKGDRIVAWYVARPDGHNGQDTFNRTVYQLARYYNAKICPENNVLGDLDGYGKRFRLLDWLQPQLDLEFNSAVATKKTMNRPYGMHIDEKRKRTGDKYIQEWLLTPCGTKPDGTERLVLHTLFDEGLLKELIAYNYDGNFDRVAALRMCMYFGQELQQKRQFVQRVKPFGDFFTRELFVRSR